MAPKNTSPASLSRSIAFPYRLYFLYLDPIMALGGVYLIFTNPDKFIASTVPSTAAFTDAKITPLTTILLTNIAALYAYLAINEALVLRVTKQLVVWKAVIFSLVLTDVGHVYSVYAAAPERMDFGSLGEYTTGEAANLVILLIGLLLRVAFLAGIGNRR